jgi:hypothetical protein
MAQDWTQQQLIALIVEEAQAQGLSPALALQFALAETSIRNVVGDTHLADRPGYMEKIREEHPENPYVGQPELWASYGPFQLQARWFVRGTEDPRVLLDPFVSVPRAITFIKRKLDQAGGDPALARALYVCGSLQACSDDKLDKIAERWGETEQRLAQLDLPEAPVLLPEPEGPKIASAGSGFAQGLLSSFTQWWRVG